MIGRIRVAWAALCGRSVCYRMHIVGGIRVPSTARGVVIIENHIESRDQ